MKVIYRKTNKMTGLCIILIVILFQILMGCASQKVQSKNIPVSQIVDNIKKDADISKMKEGSTSRFKKLYDITSDQIEDFALFTAPTNIEADELAIIKLKTPGDAKKIKDKILKRLDKHSENFKNYLPEQEYLIEKNIIDIKGKYLLFVISKDAEKISKKFEESFR